MHISKIMCILILCSLAMCACNFQANTYDSTLITDSTQYEIDNKSTEGVKVIEDNKHFKITKFNNMYYYDIFDEDNIIVKSDGPFNKQPKISMIDDHLLKFTLQAGTGLSTQWGYFYDINMDVFSRTFYGIYDVYNEKVAYRVADGIVIRNIFDKTSYYKEIMSFKSPIATSTEPFVEVRFLNDGKSIKIIYLTGQDFQRVTEYFDLTE